MRKRITTFWVLHMKSQHLSLKTVYYQLARRYHPDRFRKSDPELVPRIEVGVRAHHTGLRYVARRSCCARATTQNSKRGRRSNRSRTQRRRQAHQQRSRSRLLKVRLNQSSRQPNAREPVQRRIRGARVGTKESRARTICVGCESRSRTNHVTARFMVRCWRETRATRRAAEAELSAAIKLDPKNAEYRMMLAELYRDLGLKLRAKGEAERAVAADPNNRKARELLRSLK